MKITSCGVIVPLCFLLIGDNCNHFQDDFNSSYCSAQNATRACNVVCAFLVNNVIDVFKGPIDGENLKRVMLELGVRSVFLIFLFLPSYKN